MKSRNFPFLIFVLIFPLLLPSCRTKFEQIRTNQDPAVVLKAADEYFATGEWYKAQTLYELIVPAFRGKIEAEDIYWNFAHCHYNTKQYILASHYFRNFGSTFTNSPRKEEADYLSAYSNYLLSPSHKLDQSYSEKAVEGLQAFMNSYPESERAKTCNELIDDIRRKQEAKAYDQGKQYYDMKLFSSAVVSFENMIKDFPESNKSEEIHFLIAKSSYVFADNSIYEKKEERFLSAIEKAEKFIKKYPKSDLAAEVQDFKDNSRKELTKLRS